ncbi:hypothetical protein GF376_04450 [Candidatus Peregrinibacteria bacterium]|nr:hypothetical protein [Candidatus Peregrinibacteria bacterium]
MTEQNQLQKFYDPQLNDTVVVNNEGQKKIYLIRKAFREGSLFSSDDVSTDVQVMLNKPQEINESNFKADPVDKEFQENLMKMVDDGTIKLFTPSTLINQEVYDRLPQKGKAKADFDVLNLLNKIREIKKLWDQGEKDTYQILNLVHSLRLIKERIEEVDGDVFII